MRLKKIISLGLASIFSLCIIGSVFAGEISSNPNISSTPEITTEESKSNPTEEEIKLMEEFDNSSDSLLESRSVDRGAFNYYVNFSSISSFVNARSGPGTNYSIKGKFSYRTPVNVAEIKNGWARCVTYYEGMGIGQSGALGNFYIKSDYLKKLSSGEVYKEYLTTSNLNVRSGAGTSYSILHTLSNGSHVAAFTESNGFKLVWSGAHKASGYASSSYLKFNRNWTIGF